MKKFFPLFLSVGAIFFMGGPGAGCFPKDKRRVSAEEIQDYFVNPSALHDAALAARSCDTAGINTAFRAARNAAVACAAGRVWMTDSAGSAYLLGFATPPDMRRDTAYPLIIYLHGGVLTRRNDKGDSAYRMLSPLADTLKLFFASPSADRSAPWWSAAGLSRILQTVRFMTLHYPVHPRKIFLAGVSDGATGCYAAANTIPAPFAGFIAVSGFGGMLPAFGMRLEPANLRQRPLYNVNAGRDRLYRAEEVRNFILFLQKQGVPVTLKIYPDENHGFDYREREMASLAGIVRTWSRPERPPLSWTFIPRVPNSPDYLLDWTLASDNASVKGCWRHDTLVLCARGLRSLTVRFPAAVSGGKIVCRIAAGNGKERTRIISPAASSWPRNVLYMAKGCFPDAAWNGEVYTIGF